MMNHEPAAVQALIEIRREYLSFLRLGVLFILDILHAQYPCDIPRDLDHDIAQAKFH